MGRRVTRVFAHEDPIRYARKGLGAADIFPLQRFSHYGGRDSFHKIIGLNQNPVQPDCFDKVFASTGVLLRDTEKRT